MKDGSVVLRKVISARGTLELPPEATVGVTVGTDIAEPGPAPIGTGRMGAEMGRGVHRTAAPARGDLAGWRTTRQLGSMLVGLLTGGTGRLAGEARKRLGVAGTLGRRRQRLGWPLIPTGTLVWPGIMQHDAEPEESQKHQLVEKEV